MCELAPHRTLKAFMHSCMYAYVYVCHATTGIRASSTPKDGPVVLDLNHNACFVNSCIRLSFEADTSHAGTQKDPFSNPLSMNPEDERATVESMPGDIDALLQ